MFRKPAYLTVYALFLVTLLAACASPTPAQPVATSTSLPTPITPTSIPISQSTTPTPLPGYTDSPDWLPAGEISFSVVKVPYSVTAMGVVTTVGKSTIYLVRTDGTGLVQLADGPSAWNDCSTWSPDGSQIIYASGDLGAASYSLWVINADGSNPIQRTKYPPSGYYPAWSPDSAKIVFNSMSYENYKIAVMNADGSDQKLLTDGRFDVMPSFSPNGKIMYLQTAEVWQLKGDLFTMNSDGTGTVQLTKVGYIVNYALSPDGTKVAIYNYKDRRIEVGPVEDGGSSMTLVDSDLGCSILAMSWSPDGQALAVACSDYGLIHGSPLYIFKADGSSYTTVPGIEDAYDPAWRP